VPFCHSSDVDAGAGFHRAGATIAGILPVPDAGLLRTQRPVKEGDSAKLF
jgi:hypothetical protein